MVLSAEARLAVEGFLRTTRSGLRLREDEIAALLEFFSQQGHSIVDLPVDEPPLKELTSGWVDEWKD